MQHDNEVVSLTAQQLLDEGMHCYNKKDFKGSLYFLEALFLLETNNIELITTIINILQEIENYKEAEFYIDVLLGLDAENENYQFIQAENLFYQQSYVKALPLYLKLHSVHPLNTHILQQLLAIYSKQNKRSEIKQVQVLLEQAENSTSNSQVEIDKTVKLALSLVEQGMDTEAKALIEGVFLFDRENINANGIYGALLSDDGEFEKALYYLDKIAFKSSSEYIAIYTKCLKEIRGITSIVKYLEQRVNLYPQEYQTKNLLGFYYFNNNQYRKSYQVYKSIKKYYHEDLQFLKFSAMSRFMAITEDEKWFDKDKLAAAASELHVIYNAIPNDEDILFSLINYYINIGEIKKSYQMIESAKFDNENFKLWAKRNYFSAIRDKNLYFKSYLAGRNIRDLLVNFEDIKDKVWCGEPLKNKKVVILREQGIGDEILFASNYSWVVNQALTVEVFCSDRLNKEFSRIFPSVTFHSIIDNDSVMYLPYEKDQYIYSADFIILAGDLPAILYNKYGFPLYDEKYYLVSESNKNYWLNKLSNIVKDKLKIGIIWRSGKIDSIRSSYYLKDNEVAYIISEIPEVEFFNCMYVECNKEISNINKITKRKIHNIPDLDQKNDFENTAAMLSCLDLFVGAYTATTSLALAVGTSAITYSADYLKEDAIIKKEALYYKNATHISLPVNNDKTRELAILTIINEIRNKFNL